MKTVKTLKEIKSDPRIDEIYHSDEGFEKNSSWWCYLKPGFQVYNNRQHSIHEATIKEICNVINTEITEWPDDPELNQENLSK